MLDEEPETLQGTGIDITTPHSARIWNYWLGGKDNYAVDREAGDAWIAAQPEITAMARESRAFLRRAVTYLTAEAGIRQFLDVGTGLPTACNTHEVAQRIAPESRIVYVDNDPLVLAHARALLKSTPDGTTRYLDADMNDTGTLLARATEILDLSKPVGVMFMGVLGHVPDTRGAVELVQGLMARMPAGSFLTVYDGILPDESSAAENAKEAEQEYAATGAVPYRYRRPDELATVFGDLPLVDPGFVMVTAWRPEQLDGVPAISQGPVVVPTFGGMTRKP